jgi:predicted metal-dependent HD superfamily phosphohydrolase
MPPLLEQRWCALWTELKANADPLPSFHLLVDHYSEPHRAYHNLRHIEECPRELDTVASEAKDRVAVALALWFHDAIYEPRGSDNEEQSAALMLKVCAEAGVPATTLAASQVLIMATKTHTGSGHLDIPLIVDIDLSILGKDSERFEEYEHQIRQEYAWVPAQVFRTKRAEILENFLARQTIYCTSRFQENYEVRARTNLKNSIAKLRG